jgi:hypothetical protein
MRKAAWLAVAAVGVAAISYAVVMSTARADVPEKGFVVSRGATTDEPTKPDFDLPDPDGDLNKLPGPVVAEPEIDAPPITQSPVPLP